MQRIFTEIRQWSEATLRGAPGVTSALDPRITTQLDALVSYGSSLADHKERERTTISYHPDGRVESHLAKSKFACPVGYTAHLPRTHTLDRAEQRALIEAFAHQKLVVNALVPYSFDDAGLLQYDFWATYARADILTLREVLPHSIPKFVADAPLKTEAEAEKLNWRLNTNVMTARTNLKVARDGGEYDRLVALHNEAVHAADPTHYLSLAIRPSAKVHKGLSHLAWNFTKQLILDGWLNPAPELVRHDTGILQFRRLSREAVVQGTTLSLEEDRRVLPPWALAAQGRPLVLDTIAAWTNHFLEMLDYTHNYPRFAAMLNAVLAERFPDRRDLLLTKESPQADDGGTASFSPRELCHLLNNAAVAVERAGALAHSQTIYLLALRLADDSVRHRIQYNLARVYKKQSLALAKASLEADPEFDKAARLLDW